MFSCYVVNLSELPLIISNILCLQKYFILYLIYFTFYVILHVTLFTMAGPAVMPFYVNRLNRKSDFWGKNLGFIFWAISPSAYNFYLLLFFNSLINVNRLFSMCFYLYTIKLLRFRYRD